MEGRLKTEAAKNINHCESFWASFLHHNESCLDMKQAEYPLPVFAVHQYNTPCLFTEIGNCETIDARSHGDRVVSAQSVVHGCGEWRH